MNHFLPSTKPTGLENGDTGVCYNIIHWTKLNSSSNSLTVKQYNELLKWPEKKRNIKSHHMEEIAAGIKEISKDSAITLEWLPLCFPYPIFAVILFHDFLFLKVVLWKQIQATNQIHNPWQHTSSSFLLSVIDHVFVFHSLLMGDTHWSQATWSNR